VTTGDVHDHPPRTSSNSSSLRKRQGKSRGRPRKLGPRYANDRLKKPTVAQSAKAERLATAASAERLAVLKQPHRLGNDDRLCESALGRIIIEHNAPRELFATGVNFGELVKAWSRAVGAPSAIIPALTLTVRNKKSRSRQEEYWVVTNYNQVKMKLRPSVVHYWDNAPWVDDAAARARRAEELAKDGHKKLRRLRRPLDSAIRIMLGAAANMRPALRYPAAVLDRVRTVCVDCRDLNDPADEPMVLAALLALFDSGTALAQTGRRPTTATR
jgi:hypothetical protein